MDRVQAAHRRPKNRGKCVKKVRPAILPRKMMNLMKFRESRPFSNKKKLKDMMTDETANIVDAGNFKKNREIQTNVDQKSSFTQTDADTNKELTQTYFISDDDDDDVTSTLEVEELEQKRNRHQVKLGKRKRKQQIVGSPPLIVEASECTKLRTPPMFFRKYDNDIPDKFAEPLKSFYKSLMEISADVSVAASSSDSEESQNTVEEEEEEEENEVEESGVVDKYTDHSTLFDDQPISFRQFGNKNKVLVCMRHPFTLFFKGTVHVTVLRGCIEILGYILDTGETSGKTVYSPNGSCMVGIETCLSELPCSDEYERLDKTLGLLDVASSKDIISDIEHRSCVILLETPTSSPLENCLKNFGTRMQLFSFSRKRTESLGRISPLLNAEALLNCMFEYPDPYTFKQYQKSSDWEELSTTILRSNMEEAGACTVICGGKDVGKSTLFRFLVNRNLTAYKEVLCLDFDPGQPEFTVPGCVSAVVVTQPLLGPNFTHPTKTPESMVFVGEVDIAKCPQQYLDSAQHIIDYCRSRSDFQKMPCIVNTMGFNMGIGVDLNVSLLRLLNPRFVVQIEHYNRKQNFPSHLSPGYVWQYQTRFNRIPSRFVQYSLIVMESAHRHSSGHTWSLPPRQLREAMVLSHVSEFVQPEVVPYKIEFSKLILFVSHASPPHSQILSAMNGNLVALCMYKGNDVLVPDDPSLPSILRSHAICPCLGFGIVRGIDPEKKNLYLATNLPENKLSLINCLMLGSIVLPNFVYTEFQGCNGHVPYVAMGTGQITSRIAKGFFRPSMDKRRFENQYN